MTLDGIIESAPGACDLMMVSPARNCLRIPGMMPGMIARERLDVRLDAGLTAKVVLISAPAGYGKTTVYASLLPIP